MSVAIVTDSTSDLTPEMAAEAGITVVPLFVNFGDRRYADGVDLSRAAFYRMLASESVLPTTSQPTAVMFEDAFRPLIDAGHDVVCITIDGNLSGTVNAATAASNQFPDASVCVVDGQTVTAGLALIALRAAERARAGATCHEIVAGVEHDRARGIGFATVPDLTHAVRTGRLSRAQAFVGSALKILPVLRIGRGEIGEEARVRTQSRALEAVVDAALREGDRAGGSRYGVVDAAAPELGDRVETLLREKMTKTPYEIRRFTVGPVVGTHAGSGAAGVFVLPA